MMSFTSVTYLKGVKKHRLSMIIKNSFGVCIKQVLDIDEPFILNENDKMIKILDNNYYILEIIPFTRNCILRVHLDDCFNVIERFYLITKNNCVIDGVLSYRDFKLAYVCTGDFKKVYNQDRFEQMKKSGEITVDEYEESIDQINKLIDEIDSNINDLYNLDYKQLIIEGGI